MPGSRCELRAALRRGDFERVRSHGQRVETRHFIVFIRDREDGERTRLGITVTRRVGNAVRRNRIKRLVREWFRHRSYGLGACDLNVIAKRAIPASLRAAQVGDDLDEGLVAFARSSELAPSRPAS